MSGILPSLMYADVLWDTSVLPASITVGGITYLKKNQTGGTLASSINGVESRINSNPTTELAMIARINRNISYYCYGGAEDEPLPFDCKTTAIPYPSRFIIMNGTVTVGTQSQMADQLIVTASNTVNYLQTDWRSPPDYNPGPLA